MISRASLAAGSVVGLVFGLLLYHLVNVAVWLPAAREDGRERLVAELAAADRKSEIERKGDDAVLRGKSDFDLCVDGLKFRRLGSEACATLKE